MTEIEKIAKLSAERKYSHYAMGARMPTGLCLASIAAAIAVLDEGGISEELILKILIKLEDEEFEILTTRGI